MVKPLVFKGDKKSKKRKRDPDAAESRLPRPDAIDAEELADDEGWVSAEAVSDVGGPVMFVLPTLPPSALACDATGKVFAVPIENIVDGNPASAEPHDARQVWVASRVAGTEHFLFKCRYGKYLSCDKSGLLSAASEAVSPLESFLLVPPKPDDAPPNAFQIRTPHNTFVVTTAPAEEGSAGPGKGPRIRGDGDADSLDTVFRIRMQARFKPRLRQNKEEKAREKISRRELEQAAGRRLEEDEVRRLKRARREGDYHEQLLALKVKNKHDKFG